MYFKIIFFNLILTSFILQSVFGQEIQFVSGDKQVSLIELYTSQGCSSCPPADIWLSSLKNEPNLWKEFVPVAFHVNYWDYLGWKDRFSKQTFSDRHRTYISQGHAKVVYTPGFFLNGKEWRSRFGRSIPTPSTHPAGTLNATLNGRMLNTTFMPTHNPSKATLNIGILGFGYQTPIHSGENSNRVLNEDFVILEHIKQASTNNKWTIELPSKISQAAEKYALAIWVNEGNNLLPLQATGGWLPATYYKN